jgi:hypothetical protein
MIDEFEVDAAEELRLREALAVGRRQSGRVRCFGGGTRWGGWQLLGLAFGTHGSHSLQGVIDVAHDGTMPGEKLCVIPPPGNA